MLKKSSDKSVMNSLCSGMFLEIADKFFILHKEAVNKRFKMLILNLRHYFKKFIIHLLNIPFGAWHIIALIIRTCFRFARICHVKL